MIDHRWASRLAATAIDFPLDPESRDELDAHLRGCIACRADAATYVSDAGRLAASPWSLRRVISDERRTIEWDTRPMYQERASRLPGDVVWTRTETMVEDVRILPDGCMDLIWSSAGELFVAGPDTVAQLHITRPGRTLTGLRFAPGVAPLVLGVAAHDLADRRVQLAELWHPSDARRVADQLAESTRPGRVLEVLADERLGNRDPSDVTIIREVVRLLRARKSVTYVARAVGLSERQLRRRSMQAFGYGPKTLARVLRAQRAIDLTRSGSAMAVVALRAGFADQAHMARDVRALAGVPLTYLLAEAAHPPADKGAKKSTLLPSGSTTIA